METKEDDQIMSDPQEQQQQPVADHQFITLPSYRDHLPAKYYETGRHWRVEKHSPSSSSSSIATGVMCTCCYCGYVKYSGDPTNFGKSFCHLTGHFTRHVCPDCPAEVTAVFKRLAGRLDKIPPGSQQWTTRILSQRVWDRLYPQSSSATTVATTPAKRTRKPTPKAAPLAKSIKKARTDETVAASFDHEKVSDITGKAAEMKTPTTSPSKVLYPPSPMITTPHDLTRIVQDGHSPVRLIFYAVTGNGGKEALQQECCRQCVESRWVRIWKLVSLLEMYPLREPMMAALEIVRAGRSVHSFLDGSRISKVFRQAERMVQEGLVAASASTNDTTTKPIRSWLAETSPHSHHVEETAFLYHDPPSVSNAYEEAPPELSPLLDPPEFDVSDEVANNVSYPWHWDGTSRVVMCRLSSGFQNEADKVFWGSLLECDHLTVVSSGLLDVDSGATTGMWDLRVVQALVGDRHHHKFMRFVRKQTEDEAAAVTTHYEETDELLEGRIGEYMDYLDGHTSATTNTATMQFVGTKSKTSVAVDVAADPLYLMDLDLQRILPRHHDDFVERWKVPQVLPGGSWCMTNYLSASARPATGPNMYISPGGASTQLHQKGNGTVDSGHYVLKGYNEVVMLRRLPERHKRAATERLTGHDKSYDPLYGLPHGRGQKLRWPTVDTIKVWRVMGYCPSVFILGPGQHVHINKGRLHAFRKVTNEMLPKNDCHYELRKQLIREQRWQKNEKTPLCVSIAWDWQFIGASSEGINREVTSTLECQLLADKRIPISCVATPKTCLLSMSKSCLLFKTQNPRYILAEPRKQLEDEHQVARDKLLLGVTPSLLFVLDTNIEFIHASSGNTCGTRGTLQLAPKKDTALNPLSRVRDPDGSDYVCRLCQKELENSYLRCNGCEQLLQRDFNICMECYTAEHWRSNIEMVSGMSASNNPMFHISCMSHTGSYNPSSAASCHCPQGGPCHICGNCYACSCTCHSSFTLRRRYFDLDELVDMKERIASNMTKEPLEYGVLTKTRLMLAMDRRGKGHQERFELLKTQSQLCPRNKAAENQAESNAMVDRAQQEPPGLTTKVVVILDSEDGSVSSNESLPFLVYPRSKSPEDGHYEVQNKSSLCVQAERSIEEKKAESIPTAKDTAGTLNVEVDSESLAKPREDEVVTNEAIPIHPETALLQHKSKVIPDKVQATGTSSSIEDIKQTAEVKAVDPEATLVQSKNKVIPDKVQATGTSNSGEVSRQTAGVNPEAALVQHKTTVISDKVKAQLISIEDSRETAEASPMDPEAALVQHKNKVIPDKVQATDISSSIEDGRQTAEASQVDPEVALVQNKANVISDKVEATSISSSVEDNRQTAEVDPVDAEAALVEHETTVIPDKVHATLSSIGDSRQTAKVSLIDPEAAMARHKIAIPGEAPHNFTAAYHQTEYTRPLDAEKDSTPLVSHDIFPNQQDDTTQTSCGGEGSVTRTITDQKQDGIQDVATQAALEALSYLSEARTSHDVGSKGRVKTPNQAAAPPQGNEKKRNWSQLFSLSSHSPSSPKEASSQQS